MTASSYVTSPELYDRVYAGFVADIAFHRREAQAARGPTLEVCCGSGRILIPLREAGVPIEGLDFDAPMLEQCRRKLAERGLSAPLHAGDMRAFSLPGRYAYVYIPFNSFLHNDTQEDQLATLRCCREHLAPGGQLTIVVYHPSVQMLADFDGSEKLWKEVPEAGGRRLRIYNAVHVDRVAQQQRTERRVDEVDPSGAVAATHRYSFRLRYVWTPEMGLLLRTAGFARWEAVCPFTAWDGEPFDPPKPPQEGTVIAYRAWRDA
jgi:SAM-dependent methyltransferase